MPERNADVQKTGLDAASTWISGAGYHVGIAVPDIEVAREFYCDILGFEVLFALDYDGPDMEAVTGIKDVRVKVLHVLVPGGIRIEFQQYEPQGKVGETAVNNQGLNHLSFGVNDIQAEYERLKSLGVNCRTQPAAISIGPGHPLSGFSYFYLGDPWGLTLEIMGPTLGHEDEARVDERPSI